MDTTLDTLDQIRTTTIDLAIKFGPRVLAATLILVLGYVIGRWMAQWLERALAHVEIEPPVRALIARLARVAISTLFIIMALQNLGVELLPLIAGLGVAGAGIALAMQGVLGNLFAGLTIIFTKPFKVGEYIDIVGEEGRVDTITLFQTTLLHPDRSRVVIPNRKIVGEILHNFGQMRQIHLTVMVPHGSDLAAVLALVREVVGANARVLADPAPVVGVAQIELAGVRIGVNPWVRVPDVVAAEAELYRALADRLAASGVAVPLPKQEVRVLMSS